MYKSIFKKLVTFYVELFGYPSVSCRGEEEARLLYWQVKQGNSIGVLSKFRKQRADIVAGILKSGDFVLDLGCGDCAIIEYLREKIGCKCLGVDFAEVAREQGELKGIDVILGDITDSKFLESLPQVDYILALELLEHLANPEKVLLALREKSRKGFIISVPNTGYIVHRLRLLCGRFPLQWVVFPGEHLRFWTYKDLKWWLKAQGMFVTGFFSYEGIPVLNRIFPSLFAKGLVVSFLLKP